MVRTVKTCCYSSRYLQFPNVVKIMQEQQDPTEQGCTNKQDNNKYPLYLPPVLKGAIGIYQICKYYIIIYIYIHVKYRRLSFINIYHYIYTTTVLSLLKTGYLCLTFVIW